MPTNEFDDETVARLLAADAKASSSRYAAQGLSAFLPGRSDNGAPKPNTRFLKNLVRDADSHNAALKRKEDNERRERLRQLDRKDGHRARSERGRQEADGLDNSRKRRRPDAYTDDHDAKRSHRSGNERGSTTRKKDNSRSRSPAKTHRQPRSQLSRSPRRHYRDKAGTSKEYRRRLLNTASTEDISANPDRIDSTRHRRRSSSGASSDPLEELVGPLLPSKKSIDDPVRSRGRGAYKESKAAVDARFSANYDPAMDVGQESGGDQDDDDWEMALEAMRDRQNWQRKQADRLRAAGFNDDEIQKWNNNGKDQDKAPSNIRWSKVGEGREWDAGKTALSGDESNDLRLAKADPDQGANWKRKSNNLLKHLNSSLR